MQAMTDIEFVLTWLFTCAKLNSRGKCAKILRGEIDYHELFGRPSNDDVLKGFPKDMELTDVPGYDGRYKMARTGEVASYVRPQSPKILKPMCMESRGGHNSYVSLVKKDGSKKTIKVSDVYEMTFGKPMEGV